MELDLDQTDAVLVRPILFIMEDAKSRPVMLILDPDNLSKMLRPSRDDDDCEGFDLNSKPLTPTSLSFRPAGGPPVLRLNTEESPALDLPLPPRFLDVLRVGGRIRWRRQRTGGDLGPKLCRHRPRPLSLTAVVLQEIGTPTLIRAVSPDPTTAAGFDGLNSRGRQGIPVYRVDVLELDIDPGHAELTFRIAASQDPAPPAYFRGSLSFDFLKGGPPPVNRN